MVTKLLFEGHFSFDQLFSSLIVQHLKYLPPNRENHVLKIFHDFRVFQHHSMDNWIIFWFVWYPVFSPITKSLISRTVESTSCVIKNHSFELFQTKILNFKFGMKLTTVNKLDRQNPRDLNRKIQILFDHSGILLVTLEKYSIPFWGVWLVYLFIRYFFPPHGQLPSDISFLL